MNIRSCSKKVNLAKISSAPEMEDEKLYKEIVERLGKAENILDIGCGEGELCNHLAKTTKKKITGLDISNAGFKNAKKRAARIKVPNLVECVKGDAHNMPYFKDDEFDAITMLYTLHHIEDEERALREIRRVLKPKGRLIMADYVIEEGKEASECHKFSFSGMERLIGKAKFSLSESRRLEPDLALFVGIK